MQAELLIFDLDGTLVDSGMDIANAINHTRQELGMSPHDLAAVLGFVGDGFDNLLQRAVGVEAPEKVAQARGIFSDYYQTHILDNTDVYPGMREVLEAFADKKKILITNKRQRFADIIVERLALGRYFLEVIGGDTFPYMKPDARLIMEQMLRHNAASQRTVVIGDGVNDILLARNGGGISCAYLRGLTNRELLLSLRPDFTYETPLEILRLFE